MQPLYTEAEFKEAKSRQPLPLRCLHCSNTFYWTKNDIQSTLSKNPSKNTKTGEFCSTSCSNTFRGPPQSVSCEQCNKRFNKKPSAIKKTKHNFCSSSCSAKWNNTHKTKGTRVSKLEIWLSKQLPALYPDLEFHFNRKDAINGELDIYIPSLSLAFELNGIFHYEPIYGQDKLDKIHANDERKYQACLERNIELCLVDVSAFKNFKEQRAMKFLIIIQNIINSKLSRSLPASSAVSSQHHVEVP